MKPHTPDTIPDAPIALPFLLHLDKMIRPTGWHIGHLQLNPSINYYLIHFERKTAYNGRRITFHHCPTAGYTFNVYRDLIRGDIKEPYTKTHWEAYDRLTSRTFPTFLEAILDIVEYMNSTARNSDPNIPIPSIRAALGNLVVP